MSYHGKDKLDGNSGTCIVSKLHNNPYSRGCMSEKLMYLKSLTTFMNCSIAKEMSYKIAYDVRKTLQQNDSNAVYSNLFLELLTFEDLETSIASLQRIGNKFYQKVLIPICISIIKSSQHVCYMAKMPTYLLTILNVT